MNIPDEAVEAAAKFLHDIDCRSAVHSGHPADFECYGWAEEARELLGIVAPLVNVDAANPDLAKLIDEAESRHGSMYCKVTTYELRKALGQDISDWIEQRSAG